MTGLQNTIKKLNREHPEWSYARIARTLNCSRTAVQNVLGSRAYRKPTPKKPVDPTMRLEVDLFLDAVFTKVLGANWDRDK